MIELGFPQFLVTNTSIAALLSEDGRHRIFPGVIPQKQGGKVQMPCVVYMVTSETKSRTYCGTIALTEILFSVDCYHKTLLGARALNKMVRDMLLDYRGMMGDVRVRDISLFSSVVITDMDPGLMRVADVYSVWYEEE